MLCAAISSDQQYLVSGGVDGLIHVWDYNTCEHVKYFKGHRGPINGLVFRLNALQLFSASEDRTVKVRTCHLLSRWPSFIPVLVVAETPRTCAIV